MGFNEVSHVLIAKHWSLHIMHVRLVFSSVCVLIYMLTYLRVYLLIRSHTVMPVVVNDTALVV